LALTLFFKKLSFEMFQIHSFFPMHDTFHSKGAATPLAKPLAPSAHSWEHLH
jgi:hypothetical protein